MDERSPKDTVTALDAGPWPRLLTMMNIHCAVDVSWDAVGTIYPMHVDDWSLARTCRWLSVSIPVDGFVRWSGTACIAEQQSPFRTAEPMCATPTVSRKLLHDRVRFQGFLFGYPQKRGLRMIPCVLWCLLSELAT